MRRIVVRVAVLSFAISALTALVLHGCSRPQTRTAGSAMSAPSESASEAAQPEEDPAFLGATKAAVPIRPRQKK